MKINVSLSAFNPDIVYHYTSARAATLIRSDGFKTGLILNNGERTAAVYATQVNTGVNYNRDVGKTVRLAISIPGIKCLDLASLPKDPSLHSFEQQDYIVRQIVEIHGKFPIGYDAIVRYAINQKGRIHEIAIKPEVATKHLLT
jgi:hypothetical protein